MIRRSGSGADRPRSRTFGLAVFAVVVCVGLAALFGIRAIIGVAQQHLSSPHCDVGIYELDTEQASVAAEMIGAVSRYQPRLPAKAGELVLMAGLQESKLHNLAPHAGDRDSVGVLQQRPSQGWGGYRAAPLTDVGEATREFLDALVHHVPHWQRMAPADAIQAVQISADGSLYAQHQSEARALNAAFLGTRPAGVSCSFDAPTVVAAATRIAALMRAQLPRADVQIAVKRVSAAGSWQAACWLVANAERLGIAEVSYRGRQWDRQHGWQVDASTGASAGSARVVATVATV